MGAAATKLVRVSRSLVGIGQTYLLDFFVPLPELDYVTEQGRVSSANTPEVQLCSADGPDTDHHKVRSVKLRTAALATRQRTVVVETAMFD